MFQFARGAHETARDLAERLFDLAKENDDSTFLMQAHVALGASQYFLGKFGDAVRHLDEAIALYDPDEHGDIAVLYGGLDTRVICTAYSALALWSLGHVNQAVARSNEAVALGAVASHPFSQMRTLSWDSQVRQYIGDRDAVVERSKAAIAQATEKGFALIRAQAPIMKGWVLSETGQADAGLPMMRQGFEADLYRLKGELLLQQEGLEAAGGAKASFHKALDIAQSQAALSLELRAAISLARLRQSQGKTEDEAFDRLASVYGRFTEGFGTAHLIAAKTLLTTLNGDVDIAV